MNTPLEGQCRDNCRYNPEFSGECRRNAPQPGGKAVGNGNDRYAF